MPGLADAMDPTRPRVMRVQGPGAFQSANPAANAQVAWNQRFGPFTSTQIGQQREAGQPVGQTAPPEGANGMQVADGTQSAGGPGMAGGAGATTEAAFPGFFKGTPEPGIPKGEWGGSDAAAGWIGAGGPPAAGGKGRLAASFGNLGGGSPRLGLMGATQGLSGSPLAGPPPQVPGAVDPGAAAVQAQAQGGSQGIQSGGVAATPTSTAPATTTAASGAGDVQYREAAAPAPVAATPSAAAQPIAAATTTEGASREAATPGMTALQTTKAAPAPAAAAGKTTVRGYQGVQYTLNKPLPAGWNSITPQAREAWLKKNATPVSQLQADAAAAAGGYWDTTTKAGQLPQEDPNGPAPVVIGAGMSELDLAHAISPDPTKPPNPALVKMAMFVREMIQRYGDAPQAHDFDAMPAAEKKQFVEDLKKYQAAENTLALYGIYSPRNAPQPTPSEPTTPTPDTPPTTPPETPPGSGEQPGDGDGVPPGDATPPAGGTTPTVTNPDKPLQDFPTGDLVGSPVTDYGPNLNIASPEHGFGWYRQQYIDKGMDPREATLAAEAEFAAAQQQAEYNNRQSDVNLSTGALNEFKGSDLYKGAQGSALQMLNEGDPTDWEGIKNRRASDAAYDVQAQRDALATAGARRGISPGAQAGMGTRAASESRMGLSRALGELDVQQALSKRNFQTQALQNALGTMGGTSGVALSGAYNIGSKIAGNSSDYQNPYSGYTAGLMNISAVQEQIDAAKDAGKFSWGDAAEIAGQLAAAYFTGGSSSAATGAAK